MENKKVLIAGHSNVTLSACLSKVIDDSQKEKLGKESRRERRKNKLKSK